jgi:hypothetical protein
MVGGSPLKVQPFDDVIVGLGSSSRFSVRVILLRGANFFGSCEYGELPDCSAMMSSSISARSGEVSESHLCVWPNTCWADPERLRNRIRHPYLESL